MGLSLYMCGSLICWHTLAIAHTLKLCPHSPRQLGLLFTHFFESQTHLAQCITSVSGLLAAPGWRTFSGPRATPLTKRNCILARPNTRFFSAFRSSNFPNSICLPNSAYWITYFTCSSSEICSFFCICIWKVLVIPFRLKVVDADNFMTCSLIF